MPLSLRCNGGISTAIAGDGAQKIVRVLVPLTEGRSDGTKVRDIGGGVAGLRQGSGWATQSVGMSVRLRRGEGNRGQIASDGQHPVMRVPTCGQKQECGPGRPTARCRRTFSADAQAPQRACSHIMQTSPVCGWRGWSQFWSGVYERSLSPKQCGFNLPPRRSEDRDALPPPAKTGCACSWPSSPQSCRSGWDRR